ncbi:MAG: acyltransferase [Candidatus Binatia bacterium]|nr:acyltransferase [Candidatus Binatia bacterium]MDG2008273.1 acyltransferase [Candidatus Binatia bacterium]
MKTPRSAEQKSVGLSRTDGLSVARALTIIWNYLREHGLSGLFRIIAEQYLGALIRSFPGGVGIVLRSLLYKCLFGKLEGFAFIYVGAYIDHCSGIRAGRSISINSMAYVSGRGGLTLGSGVGIGPNAVVVAHVHNYESRSRPFMEQGHRVAPTFIGDDCMICANSVINAGVRVAEGTIVCAGAVVTKDTEPYSIVAGIPAACIGYRTDESAEAGGETTMDPPDPGN